MYCNVIAANLRVLIKLFCKTTVQTWISNVKIFLNLVIYFILQNFYWKDEDCIWRKNYNGIWSWESSVFTEKYVLIIESGWGY